MIKTEKEKRLDAYRTESRRIKLEIAKLHNELHGQPLPKPKVVKPKPIWHDHPRITDHAIIRYIERKLKVSLDDVRRQILSQQVVEAMNRSADEQYVLVENHWIVIKDRHVITCLDYDMREVQNGELEF